MAEIRFVDMGAPMAPPAGRTLLYVDAVDSHIKTKDSTGVVIDLSETTAYDDTGVVASVATLTQAIANLATSQAHIHNDDTTILTATNQVLSFATETDSTDTSVFTVDDVADTFTFNRDASYNFTSAVTFTSSTSLSRTITFDIIDVSTGNVLTTEVATLSLNNGVTDVVSLVTLLTVGRNGIPSAPLSVRVEARASDAGYSIPAFSSILASSSSYNTVTSPTEQITTTTTLSSLVSCSFITASTDLVATLPTAVGADGLVLTVKRLDQTTSLVTVAATGAETIDGLASGELAHNDALRVISDGSNWYII